MIFAAVKKPDGKISIKSFEQPSELSGQGKFAIISFLTPAQAATLESLLGEHREIFEALALALYTWGEASYIIDRAQEVLGAVHEEEPPAQVTPVPDKNKMN